MNSKNLGSGDLLPRHVESVFREFLGRHASSEDIAIWMRVGSVRALIDGVLESDEYSARLSTRLASDTDKVDKAFVRLLDARARALQSSCGDYLERWCRGCW